MPVPSECLRVRHTYRPRNFDRESPCGQRELELIRRANNGDTVAFESIYREHCDWVVGIARRFTGNSDDAVDVLQDTFTYVFGKLPRLQLTASMRSLLFPVIRNLCITTLRRRHNMVALDPVWQQVETKLSCHPPTLSEFDRLVCTLPEPQRQVMWLRFCAQLRLREIAATLDLPIGTVKSRLHKALKALRANKELAP